MSYVWPCSFSLLNLPILKYKFIIGTMWSIVHLFEIIFDRISIERMIIYSVVISGGTRQLSLKYSNSRFLHWMHLYLLSLFAAILPINQHNDMQLLSFSIDSFLQFHFTFFQFSSVDNGFDWREETSAIKLVEDPTEKISIFGNPHHFVCIQFVQSNVSEFSNCCGK